MKMLRKVGLMILLVQVAIGQEKIESPYKTDLLTDGAIVTGLIGTNALGLIMIKDKEPLTVEELNNLNKEDIWAINRWNAGYNNENAAKLSDIPLAASIALPFTLLLDKNMSQNAGQLSVLYVESVGSAMAIFTVTSALVEKSRPKVYNTELSTDERLENDNQRSFFSGHVAAAAAATFFTAQAYSDFYPNSKAKPYIWATAALLPAAVGYLRLESGHHFLTDVLIGYTVGAASGILIPRLHKKKDLNLTLSPQVGFNYKGLGLTYKF